MSLNQAKRVNKMTTHLYTPSADLLKALLKLPSQNRVSEFVQAFLTGLGRPFTVDKAGNILSDPDPSGIRKVWMVGHMDTVHRSHTDDSVLDLVETEDGWLMAWWRGAKNTGEPIQTGIGGDDKVGVWAALEACLREHHGAGPKVAVFFPTDEEIGCVGTGAFVKSEAGKEAMKSARCFLQLDRRGDGDAIEHTNGIPVWSTMFRELVKEPMEKFGFKPCHGSLTDIGELARATGKPAMNISSGYHNAHSDKEVVSIPQAMNSLAFAFAVTDSVNAYEGEMGELEKPAPVTYGGYYGTGEEDEWWGRQNRKGRGSYTTPGVRVRTVDGAALMLEREMAELLSVDQSMLRVRTSPDGFAIYKHKDTGEVHIPEKHDMTGFAMDHAVLLGKGFTADLTDRAVLVSLYTDPQYKYGVKYTTTVGAIGLLDTRKTVAEIAAVLAAELVDHVPETTYASLDVPELPWLPQGWVCEAFDVENSERVFHRDGSSSGRAHFPADEAPAGVDLRTTVARMAWVDITDAEGGRRYRDYRLVSSVDSVDSVVESLLNSAKAVITKVLGAATKPKPKTKSEKEQQA